MSRASELGRCGIRVALEQVARPEVTEMHSNQLQCDRRDIRRRDQALHGPSPQPSVREGEEDMQEEHRRQQVERLSECVGDIARCPHERRREVDEARGDHQRAETARRSMPPCKQTTQDVREGQAGGEDGEHQRLAHLDADTLAGNRKRERDPGAPNAGNRDHRRSRCPRRGARLAPVHTGGKCRAGHASPFSVAVTRDGTSQGDERRRQRRPYSSRI